MPRRFHFRSPKATGVFSLLTLATLGACGQSAASNEDANDGTGGTGMAQGGIGAPTGGATSGASGTGGTPATGGVSGTGPTGGVSGTPTGGVSGTGVGGTTTGGSTATGGIAGIGPGGASSGGAGGMTSGTGGGASGSAGMTGGSGGGGAGKGGSGGSAGGSMTCPLKPDGWAAIPGGGYPQPTNGGCNATPVTATTLSALNTALTGFSNKVVRVSGTITGTINVTTNTTLEGAAAGATIRGSVVIDGAINVIVRNLTIVGNNCSDTSDCQDGADALSINGGSHHVWVDHCDISNGSDGNLDVVDASDFVTVSWTKFSYSATTRDHRFSNLVGDDDGATTDAGKLGVTFHHCWWADRVQERQPRVRYGRVHIFNSLYTSSGNDQGLELGYDGNVRMENNVFIGVRNPINSTDYNPHDGAVTATGNVYTTTTGSTANRGTAWVPSSITGYMYTLEAASGVEAAVRAGARPTP
jgi:pectate lyase